MQVAGFLVEAVVSRAKALLFRRGSSLMSRRPFGRPLGRGGLVTSRRRAERRLRRARRS